MFSCKLSSGTTAVSAIAILPDVRTLTDFCLIDSTSDPGCPHGRRNKSKRHHRAVTSPHSAVICQPSCDDPAHGRTDAGDQACECSGSASQLDGIDGTLSS
jgi:hypothetical protein